MEKEEVTRVLPGVVDQLLQALVLHLQLANISVQHVEPLPGDPERRHGEDEGEEQDGDPGTVEPCAALGPLPGPLLLLGVRGGFDHRLLLVHRRLVGRGAEGRERKRRLVFSGPALSVSERN